MEPQGGEAALVGGEHEALTAAEKCGKLLASDLISRGAEKILQEAKSANEASQK